MGIEPTFRDLPSMTARDMEYQRKQGANEKLLHNWLAPDPAPSGWNAPRYAEQLRDLFIKRRAIAACAKVTEGAFNGITTPELMELLERELNGIAFENSPGDPDMRELVRDCIGDIEQSIASKGQPQGITTGLCDLDRLTHGLRPGQLMILGARTGEGKTTLAANNTGLGGFAKVKATQAGSALISLMSDRCTELAKQLPNPMQSHLGTGLFHVGDSACSHLLDSFKASWAWACGRSPGESADLVVSGTAEP